MSRNRKSEPVQDGLDLGIEVQPVLNTRKADAPRGYVRQVKISDPPLCLHCIERYNAGYSKSVPNRVTHRCWVPGMKDPLLLCSMAAMDFATMHNLTRAATGRKR